MTRLLEKTFHGASFKRIMGRRVGEFFRTRDHVEICYSLIKVAIRKQRTFSATGGRRSQKDVDK